MATVHLTNPEQLGLLEEFLALVGGRLTGEVKQLPIPGLGPAFQSAAPLRVTVDIPPEKMGLVRFLLWPDRRVIALVEDTPPPALPAEPLPE